MNETKFYEEDSRYSLVRFIGDNKNVTYLYFRENEWFLTEVWENSWDHPELSSSRYFQIRGFSGPLKDYIEEYNRSMGIQKITGLAQKTLGEFLDTLHFGDKNAKGN